MRILLVVSSLRPVTGWGTYGLNTVIGLRKLGHTVRILVHEGSGDAEERVVMPEPHHMLGSPLVWLKTAWTIRRAIKEFRPDVVHHLVEPYALAMPFVRLITMPMPPWLLSLNGTYTVLPLYVRHTRQLYCRTYAEATRILTPSNYTTQRTLAGITEQCGNDCARDVERRMRRFRFGLEYPHRTDHKPDPHCKHILYVGGIKPRKGVTEIIAACAELKRRCPVLPFHLHLVGTYPKSAYAEETRRQVDDLGLTQAVTFHGHIGWDVLEELYAKTDLCLVLGISDGHHFEGYGYVLLEASIRGIPTMGPTNSGGGEAVEDGKAGYVVDPHDTATVAERMRWILEERRIRPEDCRQWGLAHSVEQQVKRFVEVYEESVWKKSRNSR